MIPGDIPRISPVEHRSTPVVATVKVAATGKRVTQPTQAAMLPMEGGCWAALSVAMAAEQAAAGGQWQRLSVRESFP